MSNYIATDTDLTAVANAIRTKGGTSSPLAFPAGFVNAIGAIPTGPVSVPPSDVNFIDYDGTILHAYTAAEFANLSALPANQSHEGLTAPVWNWTLADAKAYVAKYGRHVIGQNYITTDGMTHVKIKPKQGRLSIKLGLYLNGTATVYWDDGTSDTLTGYSTSNVTYVQHTYADDELRDVRIDVSSGECQIKNGSLCRNPQDLAAVYQRAYSGMVLEVNIGSGMAIGASAFFSNYSLEKISIPQSANSSLAAAFQACYSLTSVSIPNGVQDIGANTFNECYSLRSVSLPKSVEQIGDYAFHICQIMPAICAPESIGLGENVYHECASLCVAPVPDGVEEIKQYDYANCRSLTKLSIPTSVLIIGTGAFLGCSGMAELTFLSDTPPTVSSSNAFGSIPTDCKIIVPYSADHSVLNAYKTATNYPDPTVYTYEEAIA